MFSLKISRLNISQQRFLSRDGDASWCLVSAGEKRVPEKVRIRELLIFLCLDRIPYYLLYNCSYHFPFFLLPFAKCLLTKEIEVCEFDARLVLPCLGMCFPPKYFIAPKSNSGARKRKHRKAKNDCRKVVLFEYKVRVLLLRSKCRRDEDETNWKCKVLTRDRPGMLWIVHSSTFGDVIGDLVVDRAQEIWLAYFQGLFISENPNSWGPIPILNKFDHRYRTSNKLGY